MAFVYLYMYMLYVHNCPQQRHVHVCIISILVYFVCIKPGGVPDKIHVHVCVSPGDES